MGRTAELELDSDKRIGRLRKKQKKQIPQNTHMRCSHCGKCCQETEMLLSAADIRKLEKAGSHQAMFVQFDRQGYARLRNRKGYCVFYDNVEQRCRVYRYRPLGCRIYPVIYSIEEGAVVDDLCPMQNTVTSSELRKKGRIVTRLLQRIDGEAERTCLLHKADKQS